MQPSYTDIIELLNNDCKKVIIVESLFSDIPVEIWQGWVNNAIIRGAGRKGTEFLKGEKVGITFIEGSLVTQHVLIEWQDKKGDLHKVNILEPYAQLYHSNSDVRSGWLDLACNYVQFGEELEHYREGLKAFQGYDVIINELIEMVESSPEFYFSRLELLIKSDTEKLPEDEKLFPHKTEIFMNELSKIPLQEDKDGEQWLEYCIEHAKKHGVERTLSVLASLPLGGNWTFSVVVRKMVEKNIFDKHFVFNWCVKNLKAAYNPVKQQNLITYLLQYTSLLSQEHFDLIIDRLMHLLEAEVEINKDIVHYHKLYIALIKTAWRFIEIIQKYDSYTQEQKILWSYIYADRVLGIFVKLQQGKLLPYDAKILADTFSKVAHKFTSNKRPLSGIFKFIPEVSHPEGASVWRTIIGGTLGVIQKNIEVLEPAKTALLPVLKGTKGKCMSGVDGGEESLLTFEDVDNYFDTYFAENNLKRAENIITALGEEIDESFEPVDFYKSMLERLLSGEELNELYLTHLMVLARQPFPDELASMVKDILEKNRLTDELNDEFLLLRGKMIFAVLNGFSQEVAWYFREKFREDIKKIFILNPERWEVVAELLGSLYASDDYVVSGENFIEALEEIIIQQSGIEIKEKFGEFINIMAWWMPAMLLNNVHKLRRKFCW